MSRLILLVDGNRPTSSTDAPSSPWSITPMPPHDSDLANISRLVEALRPWLGQIIFIGGWKHRLFREQQEAARIGGERCLVLSTDTVREAALMATPRRLTPSAIQERCWAGLERLLGPA